MECICGPGSQCFMFPVEALQENAPEKIFQAVDKFKCDMIINGGKQITEISKLEEIPEQFDTSSVNAIFIAGSTITSKDEKSLRSFFPSIKALINLYSMTEFGTLITISFSADNLGFVSPSVELKIVDPDSESILGPNQVGEIYAKGILMTPGYLNRPEEDEKLFSADGFMKTGDLAHYDDQLILHYDGRIKELIIVNGRHVFPLEIENELIKHPDVAEAGVFGRLDEVFTVYTKLHIHPNEIHISCLEPHCADKRGGG